MVILDAISMGNRLGKYAVKIRRGVYSNAPIWGCPRVVLLSETCQYQINHQLWGMLSRGRINTQALIHMHGDYMNETAD